MTRVISAVLIGLALLGGWFFMKYAKRYENGGDQAAQKPQQVITSQEQLQGVPYQLNATLTNACKQGPAALRQWLKSYGKSIQDPRKAWVELDYCRMIARDDPNEAKRIFATVKQRTPTTSPVWPRIVEMSGTFE